MLMLNPISARFFCVIALIQIQPMLMLNFAILYARSSARRIQIQPMLMLNAKSPVTFLST